jgi:hypothetical protein
MSEAVTIVSPIRFESHKPSHCLTKRYQLPEHCSILQHPNQPFSSPSSVSSSASSWSSLDREEYQEGGIFNDLSTNDLSTNESSTNESSTNESSTNDLSTNNLSSAISVDGEFDVRIDMILPSPEKEVSAPPLSDDDIEQQQQEKEEEKEEACVCVICYESFEESAELIRGRNYTSEELEDIEGKEKITDFCQTCKYNVHHRCIDEYRLTKMTDIIRTGYQRGYIQPPDVAGTFRMNCLMCAKEVEKIYISVSGEVDIVKTQPPGSNAQNQEHRQHQEHRQQPQQPQEQHQQEQQLEEIMRNRMQRRLRRRQRFQFCKNKFCSICFMFLVAVTLLVLVFRMF